MIKEAGSIEENLAFTIETNLNRTIDLTNTSIDTDIEYDSMRQNIERNVYYDSSLRQSIERNDNYVP